MASYLVDLGGYSDNFSHWSTLCHSLCQGNLWKIVAVTGLGVALYALLRDWDRQPKLSAADCPILIPGGQFFLHCTSAGRADDERWYLSDDILRRCLVLATAGSPTW